jgi:hypothetical protein
LGQQVPQHDVICLLFFITEYSPIKSLHPKLEALRPDVFAEMFLNGTLPQFDAMVTFSSLEHSGLGKTGIEVA